MDPKDPMAKRGRHGRRRCPRCTTVALTRHRRTTPDGKQNLVDTMGTYKNPFNVIVGATLTLEAGDMVPTGKLDATVAHQGARVAVAPAETRVVSAAHTRPELRLPPRERGWHRPML